MEPLSIMMEVESTPYSITWHSDVRKTTCHPHHFTNWLSMPRDWDSTDDRLLALVDVPRYVTESAGEGNKMVPLVSSLALECLTTSSAHVYSVVNGSSIR